MTTRFALGRRCASLARTQSLAELDLLCLGHFCSSTQHRLKLETRSAKLCVLAAKLRRPSREATSSFRPEAQRP